MNRILPYCFLLLFFFVSCEREHGGENVVDTTANGEGEVVGDGLFSVSEVTKVEFAPGNLKAGGHGFTVHQYDYGGLFGWGTGNRPTITDIEADYTDFYDWGNYIREDYGVRCRRRSGNICCSDVKRLNLNMVWERCGVCRV